MASEPERSNPTHIGELKPDDYNFREGTPRGIGMIVDSLQDVGAARSIVIDEDDVVLAGNKTLEAAAEAGITKVKVVEADGETLIAVRRRGLSPEKKRRLAIFDNRVGELSEWNVERLKEYGENASLAPFWSEAEQAEMFASAATDPVVETVIPREADIAWVLLAIPIEDWPKCQALVEQLQVAAKFTTTVIRPKEEPKP